MAKEISTTILINAAPQKVWAVLTDFKNYPSWNPFITSLSGNVAVGRHIEAQLSPPGGKPMTFKPEVLAFDAQKEFRWIGHLLFTGLFDGEHCFRLADNGNGTTTFIQSEKFGGILVPFLKKMLDVNTRQGFDQMNEALKKQVEGA